MISISNYKETIKQLSSEDFDERQKAIETLSGIHNSEVYSIVSRLLESEDAITRNAAIELMTAWGAKVIPILTEITKSNDPNQRLYACNILGEIRDPSAVDALLSLLPDEEGNVRFAAAEAIGKIGSKEATMPLLHYLHSRIDEPWEQFPLILTLGELRDERAVKPLLQLAENEMLRHPVLEAVSNIADEHAIPYFIEILKETDNMMLNMAILAIKKMKDKISEYKLGTENFNNVITNQIKKLSENEISNVISNLKNCIISDDFSVKLCSIFILGLTGVKIASEILISNYSMDFSSEIEDALFNLGKSNENILIECLDSGEINCRDILINVLGKLDCQNATEKVKNNINHPVSEVRIASILTLGKFVNPSSISILISLLDENSLDIRNATVEALSNFPRDLILPVLLEKIKNSGSLESVLKIISNLNPPANVSEILNFSNSKEPEIKRIVAQALKKYDDEKSLETLISFLSDENSQVREEAIRAMEGKGEKINQYLISSLKDPEPWVRYCSAKALEKQQYSEEIVDSISELLNDKIPFVRIAAIETLGTLKAEKYSENLLKLISDNDYDISQAAIISLGNMILNHEKLEKFENVLEKEIENNNWLIRKAVAKALGELPTQNSMNLLLRMLAQETENIVDKEIINSLSILPEREKSIPLLISFSEEHELRENIIESLVQIGKDVIPFIQKYIENSDTETKVNIISVLSRINNDKSIQLLTKLSSGESSPNVRKQSVIALGNFKNDQRALWAIMWAANNDNDSLVAQTAKSLLVS